jgi:hypothetical protein
VDNPQAGQLQPAGEDAPGESPEEEQARRLDALGESLAQSRSDAINAREQSGIEQQWIEDEEFYQGIDDANRNEHSNAWRTKPPGQYRRLSRRARRAAPSSRTSRGRTATLRRAHRGHAAAERRPLLGDWSRRRSRIWSTLRRARSRRDADRRSRAAEREPGERRQMVAGLAEQAQQILDEAKEKAEKAKSASRTGRSRGSGTPKCAR